MVIWLTGISGSGKTTISKYILKKFKNKIPNLIYVDGDEIRNLFGKDLGYSVVEREIQIKRIQKICKFLDLQGMVVITSALYATSNILKWNNENFSEYFEIYIKISLDLVRREDPKGIYTKAEKGIEKNVVGLDIKWSEPKNPHLVIDRDTGISVKESANLVINNVPVFKDFC